MREVVPRSEGGGPQGEAIIVQFCVLERCPHAQCAGWTGEMNNWEEWTGSLQAYIKVAHQIGGMDRFAVCV